MKHQGLKLSVLIGSVALVLPCLASASELDATLVGQLGGIGSYCSRLEQTPDGSEKFLQQFKRNFPAQTTSSAEFRNGYEAMSDALAKLPHSQGLALCGLEPRDGKNPRDNKTR
jgi:hypothetical protein